MLKPGERVVTATAFRDMIIVIGEYGTVIQMTYDQFSQRFMFEHAGDLS